MKFVATFLIVMLPVTVARTQDPAPPVVDPWIALSAIAMGLVTRLMADFFSLTLIESRIAQVGLLMLVIASGIILYASCLRLTGIVRPHEWRALFRRR